MTYDVWPPPPVYVRRSGAHKRCTDVLDDAQPCPAEELLLAVGNADSGATQVEDHCHMMCGPTLSDFVRKSNTHWPRVDVLDVAGRCAGEHGA